MKTMLMYTRELLVGTIFLMGSALLPAVFGGGSSGWESDFSSTAPSSHGDPGAPRH